MLRQLNTSSNGTRVLGSPFVVAGGGVQVDLSEVLAAISALNAKLEALPTSAPVYMDASTDRGRVHPEAEKAQKKKAQIEANNAALLAFVGSLINQAETVE